MALSMAIVLTYFDPPCFESQSYTAMDICTWFQNHLNTNRLRSQCQPFEIPDFAIFCDHLKLALAAENLRAFIKVQFPLSVEFSRCKSLGSIIKGRLKHGYQLKVTTAFILVFDKSLAAFKSLITELEKVIQSSSLSFKNVEKSVDTSSSTSSSLASVNIVSGGGKTFDMTPTVQDEPTILVLREQLVAKEAECDLLRQQLDSARAEINALKKTALRRHKEDISTTLIRLIDEANVFSAVDPASGKDALTNHTGVFMNNLNTHCSISFEKMPMATVNLFSMYFGELTINLFNKINRVSYTSNIHLRCILEILAIN